MDILPVNDFETSRIDHLENIRSLSYVDLPNVDTFRYTVLKNNIP